MQQDEDGPFLLKPSYILKEGLLWCHVTQEVQDRRSNARNIRVFKAHYGKHPLFLARVWRDLQSEGHMTRDEARDRKSFFGFMIANCFLKLAESYDVMSARFQNIDLDVLGGHIWNFIDKICLLKDYKIKCPAVWPVRMYASCDGTHVGVNEPRDDNLRRNPKNYSYKHNVAGLNYLIVLCIWTNNILYVSAGDPASKHDLTIAREEFIGMVPDGCRVIADSGIAGKYANEKRIFSVRNNLDEKEVSGVKGRSKSRQESLNKRVKDYGILKGKFTHGVDKQKKCFTACCVLTQCAIEDTSAVGEPLFTV